MVIQLWKRSQFQNLYNFLKNTIWLISGEYVILFQNAIPLEKIIFQDTYKDIQIIYLFLIHYKNCFSKLAYYHLFAVTTLLFQFRIINLPKYLWVKTFGEKNKKLYGPFLWMGFNCLKATATLRRQFTFYHSVPINSWYSFYWPRKDESLSRPWSHPVVLNTDSWIGNPVP